MKIKLLTTLIVCSITLSMQDTIGKVHWDFTGGNDSEAGLSILDDSCIVPTTAVISSLAAAYVLGNIYTRVITERAIHYRFDDEIALLQKEGVPEDSTREELFKAILEKHYKNVHKSFWNRWSETFRLLPCSTVRNNRKAFPLVQHEEDLDCYLHSIWWCQGWTVFQNKYDDLEKLKIQLKKIKKRICTDYTYTKELQKLC